MTENELLEKLCDYPELKARFEQLVSIIENSNGDTTLAPSTYSARCGKM